VFGCYTSEGWRICPRYYGSGESFVFQLEVSRLLLLRSGGDHPLFPSCLQCLIAFL